MRTILVAILLLMAGCANDPEPANDEPAAPADPGDNSPSQENESKEEEPAGQASMDSPPSLSLTASVAEGVVPFDVNLTIAVDDSDGDEVSWEVTRDGTIVDSGVGTATVAVRIESEGNHSFEAVASANGSTVDDALVVLGKAAAPSAVTVADAPDDADADIFELESLTATLADGGIDAEFKVKDLVYPAEAGATLWKYRLKISGHDFTTYVWAPGNPADTNADHSVLWDHSNAAFMDAALAVWDADADTVTLHIPFSVLEGLGASAPYEISGEALSGPIASSPADMSQDVVPDSGTVSLG